MSLDVLSYIDFESAYTLIIMVLKFCRPFHSALPSRREGVLLALKIEREFETFTRKPKFPLIPLEGGVRVDITHVFACHVCFYAMQPG